MFPGVKSVPSHRLVQQMFGFSQFFLFWALLAGGGLGPLETAPRLPPVDVWEQQYNDKTSSFRGICAVSPEICWVSGSAGKVLRTIDGGATWTSVGPPACEELDFRDIEAWDQNTAVIMSSGELDRIYRTEDGGQSWKLVFEHPRREAFFDGFAFAGTGSQNGWLMGDPLDGRLLILRTKNGGRSWYEYSPSQSPTIEQGEAGFAASGTNLAFSWPKGGIPMVAIALGGGPAGLEFSSSRIVVSTDDGCSWTSQQVPLARGESSGMFSLCPLDDQREAEPQQKPDPLIPLAPRRWVAVGGDYRNPDGSANTAAWTEDGGQTWQAVTDHPPSGYRSAVAVTRGAQERVLLIAVGPNGTDWSSDSGKSWQRAAEAGFHTLDFTPDRAAGWAAGAGGRIARWRGN